jgi:hypothetical protein
VLLSVHLVPRSGVGPLAIEAVEAIPEAHAIGRRQFECRPRDLHTTRAGGQGRGDLRVERHVVRPGGRNACGHGAEVGHARCRLDDGDTFIGGEPELATRCASGHAVAQRTDRAGKPVEHFEAVGQHVPG